MKSPTIAIVAAAATFFAASLANADAAPRRGHHARGQNAYASAAPVAAALGEPVDHRAEIVRECSQSVATMRDYTWGVQVGAKYRACMATHGQME